MYSYSPHLINAQPVCVPCSLLLSMFSCATTTLFDFRVVVEKGYQHIDVFIANSNMLLCIEQSMCNKITNMNQKGKHFPPQFLVSAFPNQKNNCIYVYGLIFVR